MIDEEVRARASAPGRHFCNLFVGSSSKHMPRKMVPFTDEGLVEAIKSTELSDKSKKTYTDCLNAIRNKLMSARGSPEFGNKVFDPIRNMDDSDFTLVYIATHPERLIGILEHFYPKPASLKSMITAILAIFKYNPKFLEVNEKAKKIWTERYIKTVEAVKDRYENNEPSERQKEGYVAYSDIVKGRDMQEEGSVERLLLGMYTYIRPLRCEYARVRLYQDGKVLGGDPEPNYIIMMPNGTAKMIIRQFKTSKTHDPLHIELPSDLIRDLKASLKKKPRDWLFENQRGEPHTRNSYVNWTLRVFKSIFNKKLTVSIIRHSHISSLDWNKLTVRDKKQIAKEMAHTVETQDTYRLIFSDESQDCECKCIAKKRPQKMSTSGTSLSE